MKSFRFRIILWTIVIAGTVMLGFGIAGNIAYEKVKLKQVDDTLSLLGERAAPPPLHFRFWDRAGPELLAEMERLLGGECVVAVYGQKELEEPAYGTEVVRDYEVVSWGNLTQLYESADSLPEVSGEFGPIPISGRGPMSGANGPPGGFGGRERNFRMEGAPPNYSLLSRVDLDDGDHWRVSLAKFGGYNVMLAVNLERVRRDSALIRRSFAIAFPVALLAMGVSIWVFVTRAIAPVRRLSKSIENVSAKSLGARLESDGEYREFALLIDHFNGMLARLDRSFTQATRFSADAAHELKTPLAILQGQLELALQEAEDKSESQRLLAGLLEETHRLKSITRKLLILAKADAGGLVVQRERFDLLALTQEVVGLLKEDEPGYPLQVSSKGSDFLVWCDETLCRQILNNLIGNALKYRMPEDAAVLIRLEARASGIAWEVTNPCVAMDSEARSRLFDRFVRGDASRNRLEDGTGLGLSLSLEFAKAQGGHLSIAEETGSDEMRICLVLPRFEGEAGAD